ncbi:MAG TPA: hypothetical protein VI248_02925 [Kineosporiaceae bacterium]
MALGLVARLTTVDVVAVGGAVEGRLIERVDHRHEHLTDPVVVRGARYRAPQAPGSGARTRPERPARFRYPDGPEWAEHVAEGLR